MSARAQVGGARARALFARLLGLGPGGVSAVTLREDRLEVELRATGGGGVALVLEPRRSDGPARPFLSTGHLSLWYRGERCPAGVEQRLRRGLSRWGGLSLEQLAELSLRDPGTAPLVDDAASIGAGDRRPPEVIERDEATRSKSLIGTWGAGEDVFADFLALDAFDLLPYEPIESSNPFVRVSHSDLECHCFMPREKASNLNVVDFPWLFPGAGGPGGPVKRLEETRSTDLTEHDVVMGSTARLREVMDELLAVGGTRPIIFTNTCLPATTGEDVVSELKRYRAASAAPILSHNRATSDFYEDLFAELILAPAPCLRRTGSERRVNLIGFSRGEHLDELASLLARLGVELGAAVLPGLRREDLEALGGAGLNVLWHRTSRWRRFVARLEALSGAPSIAPTGPFGVEGTRRWLAAIVEALSLGSALDDRWGELVAPFTGPWEELTRAAAEHRVLLAGRRNDLRRLSDPAATSGVPLIQLLEEMGFRLEVLVHTPGGDHEGEALEQVGGLLKHPEDTLVTSFRELGELRQRLAESEASAVVSHYQFDWRLSEAGKNRISLRHFEPGLEGALRSLRRLLAQCRTPFFSRYRRHLERSPAGLATPPGTKED